MQTCSQALLLHVVSEFFLPLLSHKRLFRLSEKICVAAKSGRAFQAHGHFCARRLTWPTFGSGQGPTKCANATYSRSRSPTTTTPTRSRAATLQVGSLPPPLCSRVTLVHLSVCFVSLSCCKLTLLKIVRVHHRLSITRLTLVHIV